MEAKQKISDFREELDKTLASPSLSSKESIRKLVQNQMHSSSSEVQEHRVTELCNLLDLMRSASGDHLKASKTSGASHGAWMVLCLKCHNISDYTYEVGAKTLFFYPQLKEDNNDYRVMYRKGPEGSPFHTLLAEGYVDAPLDVCLCAGWEVSMYNKWFPRYNVPPFKVIACCCLKKIGINEHVSLVRMKVPWPLSQREVVFDYFEMEYLEDGLVIVLLNSVSDTDVDKYMEEFKKFELPNSKDSVRMDLKVGGFAMKKITSNRSYFRLVGNLDLKLDFIPPWLLNFILRQLFGGACKLFQKTVVSLAKNDEDFHTALEDPLFLRIRENLLNSEVLDPKAT
ncbi:hypothetical protein ACHQM5_013371 [Ranunculus cassubicifolius]